MILTKAQANAVALAATGKTAVESGVILNRSTDAVLKLLVEAKRRLGATNKPHMVAVAIAKGEILADASGGWTVL